MDNKMDAKAAIELGIQEAHTEEAAETLARAQKILRARSKLSATYNATSGLLTGLESLQHRSGSKFTYKVYEDDDCLMIRTNIPKSTQDGDPGTLFIDVRNNGDMSTFGDYDYRGSEAVKAKTGNFAPILEFVAKQATKKGLVP